MKYLIKVLAVEFFCFTFVFDACNAMSANIETFYKNMRDGRVVSVDLCGKVIMDVLEEISAIAIKKTNLNTPDVVISVGVDEDCPITAEEELDGELAGYVEILQNVDKSIKDREGDDVVALRQQLMELFKVYSECDSDGFQKSCRDVLTTIKAQSLQPPSKRRK